MTRQRAFALIALAAGVVAGAVTLVDAVGRDEAAPDPSRRSATASDGDAALRAGVERPRYLAGRRLLEVLLYNEGRSPIPIAGLRLVTPGFDLRAPTVRDTLLPPGRRVDVPVAYGRARCGRSGPSARPQPAAVVEVRQPDGRLRRVPLTLADAGEVLDRLRSEECGQRAVLDAVDIAFGAGWRTSVARRGTALRGSIELRRRDTELPVTVVDVAGTVIFALRILPERPPPVLRMGPGLRRAAIGVEVDATRCDPHALAESKKTFRFPVWVRIGEAPEQYLEIEPRGRGRRLLDRLLQRCAPARDR